MLYSMRTSDANTLGSNRLKDVDGEWHEFESKALRRENERKEKEARRAAQKEAATAASNRERDRKRPNESGDAHRETKRPHVDSDNNNNNNNNNNKTPKVDENAHAAKATGHGVQQRTPQPTRIAVGGHSKPDPDSSKSVVLPPSSSVRG